VVENKSEEGLGKPSKNKKGQSLNIVTTSADPRLVHYYRGIGACHAQAHHTQA
jgi:hypothetical protein